MNDAAQRMEREAARLHARYVTEVVEACGLCPWAERARKDGRTTTRVVLHDDDAALRPCLEALSAWADDASVHVAFLVFPRLALARADFDRFVARLRDLEGAERPPGEPVFALAAFHPDAKPDLGDPDRLVPFLRRSPDPSIQAVRMSVLKRARSGPQEGTQLVSLAAIEASLMHGADAPLPVRVRIARANRETVLRMGVSELAAKIEDIHRDRAQTYAALARNLSDSSAR